jgi:hypothetical protein
MKKQEIEFRDSAGPASEELLFNPSHGRKPNLPEAARTYRGLEITRISIDEAKEIPEEEFMNASHGTMSKTMEHIGLAQLKQLKAMMRFQEFLKAKEKKG